jgi:hypothetical protein
MYLNGDFGWINDPSCNSDGAGNAFLCSLGEEPDDPMGWGLSLAGRYGITERTGIALRAEYVEDQDGFFGFSQAGINDAAGLGVVVPAEVRIFGITATLDHLLTDHLMVRAEARWDYMQSMERLTNGGDQIASPFGFVPESFFNFDDGEFFENSNYVDNLDDDQIVVGFEVIYNFNKFGGQ